MARRNDMLGRVQAQVDELKHMLGEIEAYLVEDRGIPQRRGAFGVHPKSTPATTRPRPKRPH